MRRLQFTFHTLISHGLSFQKKKSHGLSLVIKKKVANHTIKSPIGGESIDLSHITIHNKTTAPGVEPKRYSKYRFLKNYILSCFSIFPKQIQKIFNALLTFYIFQIFFFWKNYKIRDEFLLSRMLMKNY